MSAMRRPQAASNPAETVEMGARLGGGVLRGGGFFDDPPDAVGRKVELDEGDAAVEGLAVTRDQGPASWNRLMPSNTTGLPSHPGSREAKLKRNRA